MSDAELIRTALADPDVRAVFDGRQWHEGATEGSIWVTPSLVDAGCGIGGYREDLLGPLLRAPQHILRLVEHAGIKAIRVSASSWAEFWNFQAVLNTEGSDLQVVGGGPALVGDVPTSERQRWVRHDADLRSAADLAAAEGREWLPVQTTDADLAASAVHAAEQRDLRVALRGGVGAAACLRAGDLFAGLGNLVRDSADQPAADLLAAWSEQAPLAQSRAQQLLDDGIVITSELVALNRAVFIREALKTPFLEENAPILPHTRWILQMRKTSGYLGGRGALAERAGLVEPDRKQARVAAEGWTRMLEVTAALFDRPGILPASTSPQLTMLPGVGLKDELVLLQETGVAVDTILSRATTTSPITTAALPARMLATQTPPADARFFAGLRPWTRAATRLEMEDAELA